MDFSGKEGQFADIFGTANLTSRGSGKTGKQSNQVRVQTIEGEFNKSDRFVKLLNNTIGIIKTRNCI